MGKKLLSICIPTWNRKAKLARVLASIEKGIRGFEDEVEVCVSDNGSSDGSREYLEEYSKSAPFGIRTFFGEKNEGFDRNLLRVITMGRGKWLWMMGDDDQISEGGIGKVCGMLGRIQEDVAVVYLRTQNSAEKTGREAEGAEGAGEITGGEDGEGGDNAWAALESGVAPNKKREGGERAAGGKGQGHGIESARLRLLDSRELVEHPGGFISTIIIRKSVLDSVPEGKKKAGIGTLYIHSWLLRLIGLWNQQCKAAEFNEPVVLPETEFASEKGVKLFEYSKGTTRLSQELRYAGVLIYQYAQFIYQNLGKGELWKKYFFFSLKKILGVLCFPLFEIMCEREFRNDAAIEKLEPEFFFRSFGVLGIFYFLFRAVVLALPRLNGPLLRAALRANGVFRITREGDYGYWKKFWRPPAQAK